MGFSRLEYPHTGGTQDFPTSFALGVLENEDVRVYVPGEVDGFGDQLYRTVTYPDTATVRVTDPLPNPCTVVVERTVSKEVLEINLDGAGTVTRDTLVRGFKQLMMSVHEILDGRVDSFTGAVLDGMYTLRDEAIAAKDLALTYVGTAGAHADDAATSAGSAATSASTASAASVAATGAASDLAAYSFGDVYFLSRSEAEAGTVPAEQTILRIRSGQQIVAYVEGSATTIALTTGDARTWVPSGDVTVQHFGENTTPGTTDMTTALRRATKYANELRSSLSEYPGIGHSDVSGRYEDIAISNTIFLNGFKGVHVTKMRATALASANWVEGTWDTAVVADRDTERRSNYTYGNPMFAVKASGPDQATNVVFKDMSFEANHLANGFVVFDDTKHRCGIRDTQGHGPREFGVLGTSKNGDLSITDNRWCQYSFGETNFDNFAFRTAVLIDVRTTDSRLLNNTPFYCLVPLRAWGSKMQIIGNHPFNGSVDEGDPAKDTPAGTETIIMDLRTKNSVITNNYLDGGVVHWDVDQGFGEAAAIFANNTFIALPTSSSKMSTSVRFVTTTANKTLDGFTITGNMFSENVAITAAEFSWIGPFAAVNKRGYVSSGNLRSSPLTSDISYARGLLREQAPGILTANNGGSIALFPGVGLNGADAIQIGQDAATGRVSLFGAASGGVSQEYGNGINYTPAQGWTIGDPFGASYGILHRGNAVGTVSETGGTPTGSIIEVGGTDDNGYVKYAGGVMECWGLVNLGSPLASGLGTWASPYKTAAQDFTFAVPFAVHPRGVSITPAVNTGTAIARTMSISHQSTGVSAINNIQATRIGENTATNAVLAHVRAVGRWY